MSISISISMSAYVSVSVCVSASESVSVPASVFQHVCLLVCVCASRLVGRARLGRAAERAPPEPCCVVSRELSALLEILSNRGAAL